MQLTLGSTSLDLCRPRVMGILNVTPDSFSDGGRFVDRDQALRHAVAMAEAGAAIIDVGGESTRPGATPVSAQQQIERVVPVIEAVCAHADVPVSVDTGRPEVMRAAVAAGATMINDVYALRLEGALGAAASLDVPVCLMHMQGMPGSMQEDPRYDDVVGEVLEFLRQRVRDCEAAGIPRQRLLADPGFGFGKTDRHNLELLNKLERFTSLGVPLLVGLSRKRTLARLTGRGLDRRESAGIAAAVLAAERGASIIRTHDVAATVDALAIAEAVSRAG
ncbi:MAG: dihydropteroate synthase [Woeseiaceae bacterium]